MVFDITTTINFAFSVIIVILGLWVYRARNNSFALYISIAFALFAIAHLEILLGIASTNISIVIIRSIGYLVVIYALCRELLTK